MFPIFISYHHRNDQAYKEHLIGMLGSTYIDYSVNTGDISDELSDQAIREKIRDEYLRDSTVTIVIVGEETRRRKHVDWEIYSSMFDGTKNKKSGILVINLPSTDSSNYHTAHDNEKQLVYPETTNWRHVADRAEYERLYPNMPERITDNLVAGSGRISVVPWSKIENDLSKLQFLINATHIDRSLADYDLSRAMRRANS